MRSPTLTVVSGPPGSGKTTLAHALAGTIGAPVICRDAVKEGMTFTGRESITHAGLNARANAAFFGLLHQLLSAGTDLVAEAAFQDRLWRPQLERLADTAVIKVIRCVTVYHVARARISHRLEVDPDGRAAHDDADYLARLDEGDVSFDTFEPISLDVAKLDVDTTHGYAPQLDKIAQFAVR